MRRDDMGRTDGGVGASWKPKNKWTSENAFLLRGLVNFPDYVAPVELKTQLEDPGNERVQVYSRKRELRLVAVKTWTTEGTLECPSKIEGKKKLKDRRKNISTACKVRGVSREG